MKPNLSYIAESALSFGWPASRKPAIGVLVLTILTSMPAFSERPGSPDKEYEIEFVNVVDSTRGFAGFMSFPAINNHGDVAFAAVRNGEEGVFRIPPAGYGNSHATTAIASIEDGLSSFGNDVAINAGGAVAFDATTATESRAIFRGDGASRTLIADSVANGLAKIFIGSPSINAAGTVAFFSLRSEPGLPSSVFTGNGGPLTTLVATSPTGFIGFANVAINNSGTVVFRGTLGDGNDGIFTIRGGRLVDIVDADNRPEFFDFGDPVINNGGTIADVAFLTNQVPEIITGSGRGITVRSDPSTTPPLTQFEHPSLNNSGAIAFSASLNPSGANGPSGIYLEVSGGHSLIPVIGPGDKLFGSTVTKVDLGRFALNDRFQLAFSYSLADGRSGVALGSFDGERDGDSR
jgi:hypothetical protein